MKSTKLTPNKLSDFFEPAAYNNGYCAFIPWSNSIGFKTHTSRFHEQRVTYRLAENYMSNLGFSPRSMESEHSIKNYLESIGTVMLSFSNCEDNHHFKKVHLTKTLPLKMPLDDVMRKRRSIRQFTGDTVLFEYLSTILQITCGITATQEVNLDNGTTTDLSFRPVPSAGGIYPADIYVAIFRVARVEPGIYQYNPTENSLIKLYDEIELKNLLNCFSTTEDQISISRAGFICLLTGSAPKTMYKYGNQGLSFTLHEIGGISQNIHLAVTALGLGSVDCASYYTDEIHNILHFDGIYKRVFHTIVIGVN